MASLESLRSGRDSYAVKWREFLRVFTRNPDALICVFEGQDAKYYGPRIDLIAHPVAWEAIDSGGKSVVLKLRELITTNSAYSIAKIAYFLDRDFDPPESHPSSSNVYVTPCYSIENLYVSEPVMRRILRDEFGFREDSVIDNDFKNCLAMFADRFREFLDAVAPLNGWISIHRRNERSGTFRKLNLQNLKLSTLIQIELNKVTPIYTIFDLETAMPDSLRLTDADVAAELATFDANQRSYTFRGKFQIEFFRVFVSKLRNDCSSSCPTCIPKKRSVAFTVGGNILSEVSSYAETPECLRKFLAALN